VRSIPVCGVTIVELLALSKQTANSNASHYTTHHARSVADESAAGCLDGNPHTLCRTLLREEITVILLQADFVELRWLMPADSSLGQAI